MTTQELDKIKRSTEYYAGRLPKNPTDEAVLEVANSLTVQGTIIKIKTESEDLTADEAAEARRYVRKKLKAIV